MKKADFIVIAAVLVVIGVLCLVLYGAGKTGSFVQVELDGTVTETLPLDKDTQKQIETPYGTNTLVIKDGTVTVTDADCPDKICVRHPSVSRSGESIICLPHRLVISIVDGSGDDEIDLAG